MAGRSRPPDATVPDQAPAEPAAAGLHRYNVSIVAAADWSRIILVDATFVSDSRPGFNPVELSSDAPETVMHFLYSADEIAIAQKPLGTSRIVVRGVIESTKPTIHVRIGHGDNGPVTITSPIDSATNDKVLGDGENFTVSTLRLE